MLHKLSLKKDKLFRPVPVVPVMKQAYIAARTSPQIYQLSRPFDAAFDVVSPYAFASLQHMLLHFAHALLRDPYLVLNGERKKGFCAFN
jgi:hypothetical protein